MYFFEWSGVDARANNNVFLERDAVIGIFSESLCIREFPGQKSIHRTGQISSLRQRNHRHFQGPHAMAHWILDHVDRSPPLSHPEDARLSHNRHFYKQGESNKVCVVCGAQLIINREFPEENNILLHPEGFYAPRCAENIKERLEIREGRIWLKCVGCRKEAPM